MRMAARADREVLGELQARAQEWQTRFSSPLGLGVRKKLEVLTCMDSRVHPERILGFEIGDAEVIRNAGGRVTADVPRSLAVCQELLACDTIVLIHHTDCGGQEAARRRVELSERLWNRLGNADSLPLLLLRLPLQVLRAFRWLVPGFLREWAFDGVVKPIYDPRDSLAHDAWALRHSPLVDPATRIYGFLYRVEDDSMTLAVADEGAAGRMTAAAVGVPPLDELKKEQ